MGVKVILIKLKNPVVTGKVIDMNIGFLPYGEQVYNHSFIKLDDKLFVPIPCFTKRSVNIVLSSILKMTVLKIHDKISLVQEESLSGKILYQHHYLERKNYNVVDVVYNEKSIDDKFYNFFCMYHYCNDDKKLLEFFSEDDLTVFKKAVKIYNPSHHTLKDGIIYDPSGNVIFSINKQF